MATRHVLFLRSLVALCLVLGAAGCASTDPNEEVDNFDFFVPLSEGPLAAATLDDPPPCCDDEACDHSFSCPDKPRIWAAEFSVATLSENHTHSTLVGHFDKARGDAAGYIYEVAVARTIGTMRVSIGDYEFHPRWEVPFTFGVVDEEATDAFFTYALNVGIRWVDWPWNDYIRTSASMGVGVIYTTNDVAIDEERNDRHRAPIKIHWPVQFSFALPSAPQYQLIGFSDHSSGGTLWDTGGFDTFGWGLRVEF